MAGSGAPEASPKRRPCPARAQVVGLALVTGLLLSVGACWPTKPTAQCQARISDCLRQCPPAELLPPGGTLAGRDGPGDYPDVRTACESRCHSLCGGIGQDEGRR